MFMPSTVFCHCLVYIVNRGWIYIQKLDNSKCNALYSKKRECFQTQACTTWLQDMSVTPTAVLLFSFCFYFFMFMAFLASCLCTTNSETALPTCSLDFLQKYHSVTVNSGLSFFIFLDFTTERCASCVYLYMHLEKHACRCGFLCLWRAFLNLFWSRVWPSLPVYKHEVISLE